MLAIDGDVLTVEINMFGQKQTRDIPLSEFLPEDRTDPSPDCRFQLGDKIWPHEGMRDVGFRPATVTEVHEELGILVLERERDHDTDVDEHDEEDEDITTRFDLCTLVAPARRDVLPDYIGVVENMNALMLGYPLLESYWWAEKVRSGRTSTKGLKDEFLTFQTEMFARGQASLAERCDELRREFEPLGHEARVAKWIAERARWYDWRTRFPEICAENDARIFDPDELVDQESLGSRRQERLDAGKALRQRVM
ncbi:MAG: hypothetical protein AB7P03_22705 [Kofleriaceae bacterium]